MDVTCPICGGPGKPISWQPMHRCLLCGLVFAHPLPALPPVELFDAAYTGKVDANDAREFYHRLKNRASHIKDERLGLWSPLQHQALDWIQEQWEPKTPVLEIGPGIGAFMHALRRRGYYPIGLDVAWGVIDPLQKEGFKAHVGTVDSCPQVQASLLCSFFVLHHLPDPLGWLRTIRERWPRPLILATHPAPARRPPASSFPPRTYTWWECRSLETVLDLAGYRIERLVEAPHPPRIPGPIEVLFNRMPAIKALGRSALDWLQPRGEGPMAHMVMAVPD